MKRKQFVLGSAFVVAVAVATGLAVTSCGKKKSSVTDGGSTSGGTTGTTRAEGSSIAISGRLSITGASSLNFDATDLTALSVYCVTFTNPPVAGTGSVGSDGSFSITLNAAQQAVGCFILNGEEQVGTIVFKNPNKKSISGDAKTEQRQAFSGDTNLGAITLNLTTGKAEVDVSQISSQLKDTSSVNTEAAAHDFTGNYSLEPVTFTLPKGYMTVCAQGDNNCRGPTSGEKIWVKRVKGTYTADSKPVFGIMVWQSETAFNACGAKLGYNYADAVSEAGIDLSASGIAEGPFTWATDWADGWKSPSATMKFAQPAMQKGEIGGYKGQKQKFSKYRTFSNCNANGCTEQTVNQAGYMFFAQDDETGCRVDGKPYRLDDWRNMTPVSNADLGNGLHKNVQKKTVDGKEVVCTHIGGTFLTDGTPVTNGYAKQEDFVTYGQGASCPAGQFVTWKDDKVECSGGGTLTPGDSCSNLTGFDGSDAAKLAQLRCYADSYWRDAEQASKAGKCVREIQTNWMAETPAEFLLDDGPLKAKSQHIFELFEYDSANSGSFRAERSRFEGIQVGDNWDDCEIVETETFSLRKMDNSNDLILEMISEKRNVSDKDSCEAHYEGDNSTQKMMVKLVKQP